MLYNPAVAKSQELYQESPERDLEIVVELLEDYRFAFQENPVGSENLEIIDQLLGNNPQRLVFIDPELAALSPELELLDQWGSPYVFHHLTSTAMEVISRGPDQTLWTADDLSFDLKEIENHLQL